MLASCGRDLTVRLWDIAGCHQIARAHGTTCGLSFSPDGKLVGAADEGVALNLWPAAPQSQPPPLMTNVHFPSCLLSSDGRTLAATLRGSGTDELRFPTKAGLLLMDVATAQITALPAITNATPVFFSADGRLLTLARVSKGRFQLQSWNIINGARSADLASQQPSTVNHQPSTIIELSTTHDDLWDWGMTHDGRYLAFGQDDGVVQLWDTISRKLISQLPSMGGAARRLTFSPDDSMLAVGSLWLPEDHWGFTFWDWRAQRRISVTERWKYEVRQVAYSPDGRLFLTARGDDTARLYDPATSRELAVISGFKGSLAGAAFSPDGRTLALGASGGAVSLINVATKREVALLARETSDARSLRWLQFTPDGRFLLGCDNGGMVHRWLAPSFAELDSSLQ